MSRSIFALLIVATLAACGGGGGDESNSLHQPGVTYSDFGGLKWSSPSQETYTNAAWDSGARAYCTQQTCTNGQCVMTNFNGEAGWRLPSLEELQARHAALKTWSGYVWSAESGLALDFSTGQTIIAGDSVKGRVTCVKQL